LLIKLVVLLSVPDSTTFDYV
jgi:hypothetical protein